jgi:hypothetical protein
MRTSFILALRGLARLVSSPTSAQKIIMNDHFSCSLSSNDKRALLPIIFKFDLFQIVTTYLIEATNPNRPV